MANKGRKVVVAMSGGVDSSVAACRLVEDGYDVIGLFMRVGTPEPAPADPPTGPRPAPAATGALPVMTKRSHQGCCSAADAADARAVAGMLGIPFYALNFESDFDEIITYFADEYARGRTPNPCVVCNDTLKFGRLLDYADAIGAEAVATGHYARIDRRDGQTRLLRGVDATKDQSYVLFGIDRAILDRVMFPIGGLPKTRVRALAARYGLPNRDKPDSVDICFVPGRDYARVVHARRPDAFQPGEVVDAGGTVLGTHEGVGHYTIGQRRGLGIAAGTPIYVTGLDPRRRRVVVGPDADLFTPSLIAERVNLLCDVPATVRAAVRIRYRHEPAPARIDRLGDGRVRVTFDEPQRAVTPGQAAVFYDDDRVLGGGWIA